MNVYYTWVMPFLNSRRDLSSGREEEGVEIVSKRRDNNNDKNEVGWGIHRSQCGQKQKQR